MSGIVSGGTSSSKQSQNSAQRTDFPTQFLKQYQDIFGPGFGVNELISALPRTGGLFGGTAGLQGTAPPSPTPAGQASQGYVPPGSVAIGATQQAAGPRRYNAAELAGLATDVNQTSGAQELVRILNAQGQKDGFTLADLERAAASSGYHPSFIQPLLARIQGNEQLQSQAQQAPRFSAPAPEVGLNNALPGGITGSTAALGFGTPGQQAQVQPIRSLPTINAAQVNMQGIPDYERAVFESQFRPVERELSRQGALQQQTLASQLTQRGLGGSGTGIGQQQRAQREVSQQIQFAAEDASNRASVQRFQTEYNQRLANAGFDMQAQTENARNVLLGDTAKAENYLKTIGLNADNAAKEKDSFLKLLGMQQADLQRMDQFQLGVTDRLLNTWLQTASTLAGAGQVSTGQSKGTSQAVNASLG